MWGWVLNVGRAALPYIGRYLPWTLLGYEWGSVDDENKKEDPNGMLKAMAGLLGAGLIVGVLVAVLVTRTKKKR